MTKDEVQQLAALSRIRLTDEEAEHYAADMNDILDYVSAVQSIAGSYEPGVINTPHYNIFREDEVTNKPDEFTQDILKEMPQTQGRFMKVKRILTQEE